MQPPPSVAPAVQPAGHQIVWLGITLEGWLTILAIVLGPIIALALQRLSERRREKRMRQLTIFKELMATRAAKLSSRHVDALNAIEIEFSSGKGSDKAVSRAWKVYLDHLGLEVGPNEAAIMQWSVKANDLLIELLVEMGKALGFDFDKVELRKNVYSPKAHGKLEDEQLLLRKYVLELMEGKRAMWTGIFTGAHPVQMQFLPPPAAQQPVQPQQAAQPQPVQPPLQENHEPPAPTVAVETVPATETAPASGGSGTSRG